MDTVVNAIINIYTVIDSKIYLLVNKDNTLLSTICTDNLDITCSKYIKDRIFINNLNLKQCYTFSKKTNKFEITILYYDIVNSEDIKLNDSFTLICMDDLNTEDIYIKKSIEYLKKELVLNSTIKKLYPNSFVLPEIQKTYENLFGIKYDRRNFRKKLIKLGVIEDLKMSSSSKTGRPAKLYRFKKIKNDKVLF